ncbi:OLC1v1001431C1 [Oldenlandia corymbosa var. corymbosa]|uniref:OLC1v1001431C1 n=1 Tax=Oldenlandia corymbosa var. corymbosa TaxID=529605 RepID=A0AAV1D6D5_OLDCO|nr:OLC1v1001431C1 [Oldenlandia corymbosa var. corymbosa]
MLRRKLSPLFSTTICNLALKNSSPISHISPKQIRCVEFLNYYSNNHFHNGVLGSGLPSQLHGRNMDFAGRSYSSLLALNDLSDNKGSTTQKTRKGRGIGSGKGKTAGRGHKGQKARGTMKFGFEGGQTPLRRRVPKRGFNNPFSLTFQPVGLGKIAKLINAGKIDSSELITMKTLKDAGAVGKQIEDGVRLMGRGAELIEWPIHLEVSRVTVRAKSAVEAAGGSVRRVHYNKLGLRALLKPEWFEKKRRELPKAARPPPKLQDKVDSIGRLPAPTKPIPFTSEEKESMAC